MTSEVVTTDLRYWAQLLDNVLEEVNAKEFKIHLSQYDLDLIFDGLVFRYEGEGKDVTTKKLLDITPSILEKVWKDIR
ncbi:MAG TPA: hypothetical protein VFT87_05550 [Candidatus Saccharimonadales bacterium]|nr:hypothetical protein [Candidatus Saccharimonadales bacterium]